MSWLKPPSEEQIIAIVINRKQMILCCGAEDIYRSELSNVWTKHGLMQVMKVKVWQDQTTNCSKDTFLRGLSMGLKHLPGGEKQFTSYGYEVRGMILFHERELGDLTMCIFQLAPVMISIH
jgi:hypothetical protein